MPGLNNFLMGLGICVLGILVTVGSLMLTDGNFGVLAWGAILFGGLQALIGLVQMAFYGIRGSKGRAKHHMKVGTRVIVRSLIAIAAADGKLDDSEVLMISLIFRGVFGGQMSEDEIRKIYKKVNTADFSFEEELGPLASQVMHEDAVLVVKSMAMVAMSDGEFHASESQLIGRVATRLGVIGEELNQCLGEARSTLDALIAAAEAAPGEPEQLTA